MFNRDIKGEIYKHLKYDDLFLVSREDYILRNIVRTDKVITTLKESVFVEDGSIKILYPKASKVTFHIRGKDFDNILLYMNRGMKITVSLRKQKRVKNFTIMEYIQRIINNLGPTDNVKMGYYCSPFFLCKDGHIEIRHSSAVESSGGIKLDNKNVFAINSKFLLNDKTRVLIVDKSDKDFRGVYGLSFSSRIKDLPEVMESVRYIEYHNRGIEKLKGVEIKQISKIMKIFDSDRDKFRRRYPNIETIVVPDFILTGLEEAENFVREYNLIYSKLKHYRNKFSNNNQIVLETIKLTHGRFKEMINEFNSRIVDYAPNVIKKKIIILDIQ